MREPTASAPTLTQAVTAPAETTAVITPPAEDPAAWVRARTGGSLSGPLTVPESFFAEDPRYRALVPDAPVERLVEAWARGDGDLLHRYEVTVRRSDGDLDAIDARLVSLGRAHSRDPRGSITAADDPRVLVIPLEDGSTVRLVVWLHAREARDYEAFVAALPELEPLRAALGLDAPPEDASIALSATFRTEAQWQVSTEAGASIESLLPAQGYTREDDGWAREVGDRRITLSLDPLDGGAAVVITASGAAHSP